MRLHPALLPLLLSLLALAFAPAPASAASGPCRADGNGPTCRYWTGKVVFVADGDTIDVAIAGDHTDVARPIRITGLNAMELHRYSKYRSRRRGDCHGVPATNRLETLLRAGRMRVRLAAQHASSRSGHRLRRQVSTRIHGQWVDVAQVLLSEGHALWLSNGAEWAWNRDYHQASTAAAAAGLRLWNPRGCGAGPSDGADISMRINYDGDGNDFDNVNGEWARVTNASGVPVPLAGWWFRDSALRRFTFPAGAVVPARGTVTLRMGRGGNGGNEFHWGLGAPPFENPSYDQRGIGDGGYLFDTRGNLRAWEVYP
jgi:micrococcal nuclease